MKDHNLLGKYHSQLMVEGILLSALFGLSGGFFTGVVVFLIGIITTTNLLWLGVGICLFVAFATGGALYYFHFRPTIQRVARRVDDMGLEERAITMVELQDEDSYIAEVQREDTKNVLSKFSFQLLSFSYFRKPLLILSVATIVMAASITFMITRVNAAEQDEDPPIVDNQDQLLNEMVEELLSVINESQIDPQLKSTLYQLVVDLQERLPTYDTYMEKYADVLQTRNEILQIIADNILELEDSLMNIAETLQEYETTQILGEAIATWNDDNIIAAFDMMYDNIDDLLGQELYDEMEQTADDIEAALEEAMGTDPGMHDALQHLADAYRAALEDFEAGSEDETLDEFKVAMDQSLQELLDAIQALRDLIEELLELEEEIEEEIDQVDQFPIFMPWPEDGGDGEDPGDPSNTSENTVIDGETPYEDVYDSYYEDAMDWLSDEDIPENIRRIIENYFDMLD